MRVLPASTAYFSRLEFYRCSGGEPRRIEIVNRRRRSLEDSSYGSANVAIRFHLILIGDSILTGTCYFIIFANLIDANSVLLIE